MEATIAQARLRRAEPLCAEAARAERKERAGAPCPRRAAVPAPSRAARPRVPAARPPGPSSRPPPGGKPEFSATRSGQRPAGCPPPTRPGARGHAGAQGARGGKWDAGRSLFPGEEGAPDSSF